MIGMYFFVGYILCGLLGSVAGYAGDVKSGKDFKVSDVLPALFITLAGPCTLVVGVANFLEKYNVNFPNIVIFKGKSE